METLSSSEEEFFSDELENEVSADESEYSEQLHLLPAEFLAKLDPFR